MGEGARARGRLLEGNRGHVRESHYGVSSMRIESVVVITSFAFDRYDVVFDGNEAGFVKPWMTTVIFLLLPTTPSFFGEPNNNRRVSYSSGFKSKYDRSI